MKIFSVLAILGLFCGLGQTADLFQGYLIHDTATDTCFKNNAGSPEMITFTADTFAECTLVKVSGTGTDGFTVEDASDNTKKITYASAGEGDNPTLDAGTALQFVGGSGQLSSVAALTDSSSTFKIDVKTGTSTGQDCVTGTLAYTDTSEATTCDNELFYFALASCTGTNCKACLPDPAMCSECEANEAVNTAGTECVACNGKTDCTTCTLDDQDAIQCSACSGIKTVTDNTCVVPCPTSQTENADGTCDVLQGYLIFVADSPKCFKNNNGNPEMTTYTTMATDCTMVKVTGFASSGYIIEDATVADKQIQFADLDPGTTPTLSASGTFLKFVLGDNDLSATATLTDMGNPFVIDQFAGAATGQDCVTGTLAYTNTDVATTCDALLFYFETAACTGTNCKACLPDPAKCSECESDEAFNTAETECLACSGVESCTACTANDQDAIQCSACEETKVLTSNECMACPDGEEPNNDQTACQATTTEATTAAGSDIIMPSTMLITMVTMVGKQIWG